MTGGAGAVYTLLAWRASRPVARMRSHRCTAFTLRIACAKVHWVRIGAAAGSPPAYRITRVNVMVKGRALMGSPTLHPRLYYGWCIVATTFIMAMVSMGARSGFGVFVLPMSAEFGWNRGTISLAASIGVLVSGLSQPFLGRLYDRLGGRHLILTTHILFLILLFGVLLSIATGGSSLTTTSALLAKWFHRQRATAVALNAAGASVGGLLLVPLTVYLIHLLGWRMAWVMLGLLILLLVVPLAWVLLKDDPAEMGLLPDGDPQPVHAGQTAPVRSGPLEVEHWQQSFRSMPMWQLCGGYFGAGLPLLLSRRISCRSPSSAASHRPRRPRPMA